MKAVVPRSSLVGSRIARYSRMMPSRSRRLIRANTVVMGALIRLAMCFAVSLQLFCISVKMAMSFLSSCGCITVIITFPAYKKPGFL